MEFFPRKDKANKIRKLNKIPGVLYGPRIESQKIYVAEREIKNLIKNYERGLFEFKFKNNKFLGILREIQIHPLTGKIIHFDIYIPALERKIVASVSLEFTGEAPAFKKGGVLNFALNELEVEALPEDLPEKIIVDISSLDEIGKTIYVKDLNLTSKVKILVDENTPIVTVIKERQEELERPLEK